MFPGIIFKTLFAIFSISIALADYKKGEIRRFIFVIAIPIFFVSNILLNDHSSIQDSLIGLLLGLGIFLITFFVSRKRLGLADVWYSALIGLVLGPWWWYAAIGIACIVGVVFMLVSRRKKVPFIPFMAFGAIAAIFIQG